MFPERMFPHRMFPPRMFPKKPAAVVPDPSTGFGQRRFSLVPRVKSAFEAIGFTLRRRYPS